MPTNDKSHTLTTMRDAQREMIDANDMIDNRGQVKRLMDALCAFIPAFAGMTVVMDSLDRPRF